ncbi:DsbE family thiol:disulfide interchange protein, partial [Brucella melitensis]
QTGKIVYKHVGPFTPESVKNDLLPAVEKALQQR